MSENKNITVRGSGLGTILFVVFLILKLLGKIDWSWWWVTSPLWISWALIIGVALLLAVVSAVAGKGHNQDWR